MQNLDDIILDSLADLQWSTEVERSKGLDPIVGDWINFSDLVVWITTELKAVAPEIEETVTPLKSNDDLQGFRMELNSFLKELQCPYSVVMSTSLSDRFETPESKKIVLSFLLSELEAGRIYYLNKSSKQRIKVELSESPTAKILRELCQELVLGKPPDSITAQAMWSSILTKIKGMGGSTGVGELEPLFTGVLSPKQWSLLENYFAEFKSDYGMRREMLLKRLDVTIQSFHWSDRLKGDKEEKMNAEFRKFRPSLSTSSNVVLSDVLAARADLPVLEKTSSTSVRKNTRSAVNDVVIGKVPDRGGRPNEVEPPPPEMPSWQQRQGGGAPSGASGWIQNPNQRGQGRGGGGGGGSGQSRGGRGGGPPRGGGRVQGGWSNQQQGGQHHSGHSSGYQQQQSDNYQGDNQQNYQGGIQQQQGQGYGGGGGYQQGGGGGGGYYQHDSRGDGFQDQGQGGNYYQDDGSHGGQGQGYHRGGGRGGGRGRRY